MAPPPRRSPASFFSGDAAMACSVESMLFQAAYDGDLLLFKRLARALDKGRGSLREAVEPVRLLGVGALHVAAAGASLQVCSYLVEGLHVDVDALDGEGKTPLIYAIRTENVPLVKYFLDHGADQDRVDHVGLTPLHSAVGIGNCEMVELLLEKGAYVDPVAVWGTPLHIAAMEGQAGTMKILLDHNADCNKTDICDIAPLYMAINHGSLKCVKLLVEAGVDVKEDSTLTELIDANRAGISPECLNYLLEIRAAGISHNVRDAECLNKREIAQLKSLGGKAVERKDYLCASGFYTKAIDLDPTDATLFSNRSLCWLRVGDGLKALLDAIECREMRPDWPKACYRQGAALLLLKDYDGACEAFFEGFKLDPENVEIEHALCEAMEHLKISQSNKMK